MERKSDSHGEDFPSSRWNTVERPNLYESPAKCNKTPILLSAVVAVGLIIIILFKIF